MKRPLLLVSQKYSFSCTASVLQTAHHFLCEEVLSHEQAITLLNCRPDGASLEKVAKILKRLSGARWTPLKRVCSVRRAIHAGGVVLAANTTDYEDDHAVLLVGVTPYGFRVFDPATGRIAWKSDQSVKAAANGEFIAIQRQ
jgi:hypothetical protein